MIVVAKIKAKTGKEGEIEEALKGMVGKVEQEEGTLIYTLHRARKDPTVFMFYEKYKDKDALSYHSSTPYFKEVFGRLGPLFEGAPEIEMYEEIAGIKK